MRIHNKKKYRLDQTPEYKKHLRNGKPKTTICSICNFSTSTHWNLKLHILSHHSTKEESRKYKYYCSVCDLVFFCNTYKNKHIAGKIHKNRELCDQFQKELYDNLMKNLYNFYLPDHN